MPIVGLTVFATLAIALQDLESKGELIEFAIFFTFSLMFYPLGLVSLGLMFSKGVGFSEIFSRSFLLVTFYFFSICSLLQLSLAAIGWFPGPPIDDSMLPMVLGATPMGLVLAAAAHQVRLRQ